MDITAVNGYTLTSLDRINILLGKNGCGKSILLKSVESALSGQGENWGKTKYITPERGGVLVYEAGIEDNLIRNLTWLPESRRVNQLAQFKQQSIAQLRRLKEIVLEEIETTVREGRADSSYTFDVYLEKINNLLDNIEFRRIKTRTRSGSPFKIFLKDSDPEQELQPKDISSGESELISLAIECLVFEKECEPDKQNVLFLDEPDVHLHPDLQARLMNFLKELIDNSDFTVLIATHSTAILGALHSYENTRISFMDFRQKELEFRPISAVYRKILPVFGAHPLSNLFNETPILLLEGEDDERIWQQAVRTSEGEIKIFPCSCDGITRLNEFEREAGKIIKAVYEDAKAYSLRDHDDSSGEINDLPPITRCRLSCRNAENLLLTNEVLQNLSLTWESVREKIESWLSIQDNENHNHYQILEGFQSEGYDRKNYDIKEARNTLMGIIESSKPWEVAVGQVIGNLVWDDNTNFQQEHSIYNYLGQKLVQNILPKAD